MPTFIVVRRIFYSVLLINFKNWLHLTIKSQNVVIFVSTTYSWLQSSYLRSHLEDGEIKRLRINFILHKEVVIGIIQKGSSSQCTDKFYIVNIYILHNCKNNEEIILFFGVPLWISNCHVQFHVDMTNSSSQGETRNPIDACMHMSMAHVRPFPRKSGWLVRWGVRDDDYEWGGL